MYGLAFVGMGVYFGYALRRPTWVHARGQLLGFLAYDAVLIGPFLHGFSVVRPEYLPRLVVATAIVVGSAALAVYYLLLHPPTRLWPVARPGAGSSYRRQAAPRRGADARPAGSA
ncbi:hypothetical protein [Pseudonocardia asaccharolytica]|uniref:Uncharacterized protein n=1 Tax=Pseudonocardia asaccharolytica DSM 44247 = NBRC 16224 TaxID=1123024 RepID=A0A511D3U0_9PSEU|nr:hypothetical protein [Pseudonocardia asaccharolytica]GEL19456.1 hypothetical protein PA7_32930 [Pseudonocardia asaccharolytica DSM 44247 = NBRC 16224]